MRRLDFTNIQGNVLWGYHLAVTRLHFLRVTDGDGGRAFVGALAPHVMTSVRWPAGKPNAAINLAFTHPGLAALGVPPRTLSGFPPEYQQGMRARAPLLNDSGENAPERWEWPWERGDVHVLVWLSATSAAHLDRVSQMVLAGADAAGGLVLVRTEDAARLVIDGVVTDKEHFGFTDGYSNPEIDGTGGVDHPDPPGGGKILEDGSWAQLATGELLLGYPDEAGALPPAPLPVGFVRDGTFLVVRKLHQRVGSFRRFLREEGSRYAGGPERLAAKMLGRWPDGTPLVAGDAARPRVDRGVLSDDALYTDFRYGDDPSGFRCPMGAHVRRANPRDATGFGTLLSERRRFMRRGMAYGPAVPADEPGDDDGEHGMLFMALGASIERQFEFVQREWLNYGNDFYQGNDGDPLFGGSGTRRKFLIPGDPRPGPGNVPPYVCRDLPAFVRLLGGDYFFVPSITAIDMIAGGRVDTQ